MSRIPIGGLREGETADDHRSAADRTGSGPLCDGLGAIDCGRRRDQTVGVSAYGMFFFFFCWKAFAIRLKKKTLNYRNNKSYSRESMLSKISK